MADGRVDSTSSNLHTTTTHENQRDRRTDENNDPPPRVRDTNRDTSRDAVDYRWLGVNKRHAVKKPQGRPRAAPQLHEDGQVEDVYASGNVPPPPPGPPPKTFSLMAKNVDYKKSGVWTFCKPKGCDGNYEKAQGWKLHIPANIENGQRILNIVERVLVKHKVSFKFASSTNDMKYLYEDKQQKGKFIVVYPRSISEAFHLAYGINHELNGKLSQDELAQLPKVENEIKIGNIFTRLGVFAPDKQFKLKNGDSIPDDRSKAKPKGEDNPWNYFNMKKGTMPQDIDRNSYGFRD